MKNQIVNIVAFLACSAVFAADSTPVNLPALIPQPVECHVTAGTFALSAKTPVTYAKVLAETAALAVQQLGLQGSCKKSKPADSAICLTLDSSLAPEAYRLDITPKRVTIAGGSVIGVFYGVQTLRQIVGINPLAVESVTAIPCLAIHDQPRFAWRGLMLDCSRTFQSPDYLRKTMDRMAFYKMNVLHLHLTDDQGWRIEIKKYPELTGKGAYFSPKYKEPESHQGFYSRKEMKALVAYGVRRGITIVPEIEMPGHNTALFVCHPELTCTGKIADDIFPFLTGPQGLSKDIACAGNDATFAFFEDVLSEVMDIFPSAYIHIGGDEAPKDRWHACLKCQARIKAEGLKNEHELQSYFIRRIEKFVNSKGRKIMGWDEILEGGLAPNAGVMSWRGVGGGVAAAKAGHPVVMTPTSHCYFDYDYRAINSGKAFAFYPLAGIPADKAHFILGIQANFWSHIQREPKGVDRQLFQRLLSLAERGWSPDTDTNWPDFNGRLTAHQAWLTKMGVTFWPE